MSYLWSIRITFRLLVILFVIKLYSQTDFFCWEQSSWIRKISFWNEKVLRLWRHWIQRDNSARILFDLSIDEDYYKPIINSNCNYIEYESMGDKEKILTIKEYLDRFRPYLSDK